jgi:hypothetical protein
MWFPASRATLALLLLTAAAGCSRTKGPAHVAPLAALDAALLPSALVASLRRAGGGHFHATALLRADVTKPNSDSGRPAAPPAVTTTTDLWMDKAGSFRLSETNDQDGGRDVVRVGGDLAVALRYGKLVRRPAQDAESQRYLGEALGAPWAAWELVRRQVKVEGGQGAFALRLGERTVEPPPGFPATEGLRKWRDSVVVKSLEGSATLDAASQLPVAFTCQASFQATRDGTSIVGEVAVTAALDQIGSVPEVVMPAAEAIAPRQRTVIEERALLGGLPTAGAIPPKRAL